MRCGACCFLRGICVLRECSSIRAASSSLRLGCESVGPQEVRQSRAPTLLQKVSSSKITTYDSLPSFPLHTCGQPTGHVFHYLIVIADDPLVVSDVIVAIVVILFRANQHLCICDVHAKLIANRNDNNTCSATGISLILFLFLSHSCDLIYARVAFRSNRCWWPRTFTYILANKYYSRAYCVRHYILRQYYHWSMNNSLSRDIWAIYSKTWTILYCAPILCGSTLFSVSNHQSHSSLSRPDAIHTDTRSSLPTTAIGIASKLSRE